MILERKYGKGQISSNYIVYGTCIFIFYDDYEENFHKNQTNLVISI